MVRRALAMAASEQYFRLAVGFASIAAVSRLLTPAEVGISVIGTAIALIAQEMREFATSDFLIRREHVVQEDVRTSFTMLFLLTAMITSAMFVLAPWFGTFYGEDRLAQFLRVAAFAALIEAVSLPITGLLRRDMAFGTLALINTTSRDHDRGDDRSAGVVRLQLHERRLGHGRGRHHDDQPVVLFPPRCLDPPSFIALLARASWRLAATTASAL